MISQWLVDGLFGSTYLVHSLHARNASIEVEIHTSGSLPSSVREVATSCLIELAWWAGIRVAAKKCHQWSNEFWLHHLDFGFWTDSTRHVGASQRRNGIDENVVLLAFACSGSG